MKNDSLHKLEKASRTITNIFHSSSMRMPSDFHFRLANIYFNNKQYKKAEKHLTAALKLKRNDTNYLYRLALVKEKLGRPADAIKLLSIIIKCDPKSISAISLKGRIEYQEGKYKISLRTLLKNKIMRAKRPLSCPILYYYIGLNYQKLKAYQRAIYYYNRALNHGSNNYRIWVNRGLCNMELRKYSLALRDFKRAHDLNKKSIFPILFLISTYFHLDKWEYAPLWIARASKIEPNRPTLLDMKGYYYLKNSQPKLSIKYYEKLISNDTKRKYINAVYNLACAYAQAKKDKLAIKTLRIAIRLDHKYINIAKKDKDFMSFHNNKKFSSLLK
jgi:tetratricopeptide (TPR) repeat protein